MRFDLLLIEDDFTFFFVQLVYLVLYIIGIDDKIPHPCAQECGLLYRKVCFGPQPTFWKQVSISSCREFASY
jgi:hypothetical protein